MRILGYVVGLSNIGGFVGNAFAGIWVDVEELGLGGDGAEDMLG